MTEMEQEIKKLTLMFAAGDVARADILLSPDRIYYRFATDDSIEDGQLPPYKGDFAALAADITSALPAGKSSTDDNVKMTVFVDNRLSVVTSDIEVIRRTVGRLCDVADEFAFLRGFC